MRLFEIKKDNKIYWATISNRYDYKLKQRRKFAYINGVSDFFDTNHEALAWIAEQV